MGKDAKLLTVMRPKETGGHFYSLTRHPSAPSLSGGLVSRERPSTGTIPCRGSTLMAPKRVPLAELLPGELE